MDVSFSGVLKQCGLVSEIKNFHAHMNFIKPCYAKQKHASYQNNTKSYDSDSPNIDDA